MITRSGILREVLEEKGRLLMKYSKHGACLLPVEGYEKLFEDLNEECKLLRGMIIENATREQQAGVKPAQWQKDLMDGKAPDMSWTGATAEKAEEEIPPEGKEYVWNPETKTWDDPPEYQGKHAKTVPIEYPKGMFWNTETGAWEWRE